MYSVMLMAALTAGGQTADWHNGCGFYSRNYGNCAGSCYGNHGVADYAGGYGYGYGNGYGYGLGNCAGSSCGGYYPWDYSSSGCSGCAGSYGVGSPYFVQPAAPPPVRGEVVPPPQKPGPQSLAPTKARLIVQVPADSKVYVDDQAMKTPSERRVYQTPDLTPGETYVYDVRVEVQRDGKAVNETRRVFLKAGQEVLADFKDIKGTATASR